MDISELSNWQLLQLFADVHLELQQRGVVRTSNLLGDYTEYLVASAFSLTLMPPSSVYDAFDARKVRFQVKGRRLTKRNKSRQMSGISGLEAYSFDWLVGVLFNTNFTVFKACMIPYQTAQKIAPKKKDNKHILILRDTIWDFEGVLDITKHMIDHQNELNETVHLSIHTSDPKLQAR